jgi:hypothetical protein
MTIHVNRDVGSNAHQVAQAASPARAALALRQQQTSTHLTAALSKRYPTRKQCRTGRRPSANAERALVFGQSCAVCWRVHVCCRPPLLFVLVYPRRSVGRARAVRRRRRTSRRLRSHAGLRRTSQARTTCPTTRLRTCRCWRRRCMHCSRPWASAHSCHLAMRCPCRHRACTSARPAARCLYLRAHLWRCDPSTLWTAHPSRSRRARACRGREQQWDFKTDRSRQCPRSYGGGYLGCSEEHASSNGNNARKRKQAGAVLAGGGV